MERETLEFITPNKHKVMLNSYITFGEEREIRNMYLTKVEVNVSGDIKNIDGNLINAAENKAIEIVVISLDGDTKEIVKRVLDLRKEDGAALIKKINEITEAKKKE